MSPIKEKPGQRQTLAQRMRDVGLFVYNIETGQFLGRNGKSWGLALAFYTIFYIFLAVYFAVNMALFFLTVDRQAPKYFSDESLTLGNPGLGYRPMPNYDTSLIRFEQGKPSSYKPYTDHLQAFIYQFEPPQIVGKDLTDCCQGPQDCFGKVNYTRQRDKACQFKLDNLEYGASVKECVKENEFGYQEGEPCILLKMNKIFNWVPEVYESVTALQQDQGLSPGSPRFLAFADRFSVGVSCDGQTAADQENIQNITFYPNNGFNKFYYPYLNQEGYRSPLVFAKFFNVTKRVVIQIECKLYAYNIANTGGSELHGSVHFELMID